MYLIFLAVVVVVGVIVVVRDNTNYKLHALSMAKISSVESVLNAINTSTSDRMCAALRMRACKTYS